MSAKKKKSTLFDKVNKPKRKVNLDHFAFEVKKMKLTQAIIEEYNTVKAKPKPEPYELEFISLFESKKDQAPSKLVVTHLPTKITKDWTKIDYSDDKKESFAFEVMDYVNSIRKEARKVASVKKQFDGVDYEVVGGVFNKTGNILDIGKFTTTNDPLKPKSPKLPKTNYIGVELEFNKHPTISLGIKEIAKKLQDEGLSRYVCVGTDTSCGYEVRVLLSDDNFTPTLTKIMSVLSDMGFGTDTRCGTHVHLDMRNRDVKRCYANMYQAQTLLRRLLPATRRKSTYCTANNEDTFDKQLENGDRYKGINVMSYSKYKTLEVRLHQGTLDPNKLIPWINLLLKIVNKKDKVIEPVDTIKKAIPVFELDKEIVQALRKRIPRTISKGA